MRITSETTGREVYEYLRDETIIRTNSIYAENIANGVTMRMREINSQAYTSVVREIGEALKALDAHTERRIRNEMHMHRVFHA